RPALAFGLLPQQHLARQLDAIVLVDGDHLHLDLVAKFDNVLDLPDILVVQFADVAEAIAARGDLDEGSEVLDRGDLALVDLADADFFRQGLHLGTGGLGASGVAVRDLDQTRVVDIELGPRLLLDGLDGLAAGAYQQT